MDTSQNINKNINKNINQNINQNISQNIEKILKEAGKKIISEIGLGHSEKIYQNCLNHYLVEKYNLTVEVEKTCPVIFDGFCVGYCKPDLVINDTIIVELKTTMTITNQAKTQLQKYERHYQEAYLVNFPAIFGVKNIEIYKFDYD